MRFLKQPLLWFFAIGAVLLGADRYAVNETIKIDDSVRMRIAALWQTQMGAQPSAQELASLENNWLREELFYREALKLGLDQEDVIIRRRLVQKLEFAIKDISNEMISVEQVTAYYHDNIQEYTQPPRFSISLIYFSNAEDALKYFDQLENDADWQVLGEPTLFQKTFVMKTEREIATLLGNGFADQLGILKRGEWVGPIRSSLRFHLVRLENYVPAEPTPLEYVENKIISAIQRQREEQSVDDYLNKLLERYNIVQN